MTSNFTRKLLRVVPQLCCVLCVVCCNVVCGVLWVVCCVLCVVCCVRCVMWCVACCVWCAVCLWVVCNMLCVLCFVQYLIVIDASDRPNCGLALTDGLTKLWPHDNRWPHYPQLLFGRPRGFAFGLTRVSSASYNVCLHAYSNIFSSSHIRHPCCQRHLLHTPTEWPRRAS